MARKKKIEPAGLELLILKVLWESETPMLVREVRTELAESGRDLAHTTVITTLNTMVEKRYLNRSRDKNSFRFQPKVSQKDVHDSAVTDVLERVFDGSPEHLMLSLLDSENVGPEQLAEIRKLINRKARDLRNGS